MSSDGNSAHITAAELQVILRTDPEAFRMHCERLAEAATDAVTKQFWRDVKRFAEQHLEK